MMGRGEPRVMVAASQHGWQAALFRHAQDVGGLVLLQGGLERADLVIFDDESSQLDRHAVQTAQADGVIVVVLATTPQGQKRVEALGPDYVWEATTPAADLVALLRDVLAQRADDTGEPTDPGDLVGSDDDEGAPTVVVVLGDGPAVDVAVAAGVWLTDRDVSVALIDADNANPALAQRLDFVPLPNVVAAADKVRGGGRVPTIPTPAGAAVGGLANVRAWAEWPPEDAALVVADLATSFDVVVVVADSRLDDLSTRSRVGRFDIARQILSMASEAWVVVESTPHAHTRALDLIADIRAVAPELAVRVWAARTPKPYAAGEWRDELERVVDVPVVTLPESRRQVAAAWNGEPVGRSRWRRLVNAALEEWWNG